MLPTAVPGGKECTVSPPNKGARGVSDGWPTGDLILSSEPGTRNYGEIISRGSSGWPVHLSSTDRIQRGQ